MKNSLTLAERVKLSLDLIEFVNKMAKSEKTPHKLPSAETDLQLLRQINEHLAKKDLQGLLRLTWSGQNQASRPLIFEVAKALEEELKAA